MEMMASATPLVATVAGGIGAVATDGVTARLVAERDVRALASAIDELLRDRTAAAHMGSRARDLVCRHHSWARVAEDFEAVYQLC
jgi:glycogen(starch) synthase